MNLSEQYSKQASNAEYWIKSVSSDGTTYYYNSYTRETSWSEPACFKAQDNAGIDTDVGTNADTDGAGGEDKLAQQTEATQSKSSNLATAAKAEMPSAGNASSTAENTNDSAPAQSDGLVGPAGWGGAGQAAKDAQETGRTEHTLGPAESAKRQHDDVETSSAGDDAEPAHKRPCLAATFLD